METARDSTVETSIRTYARNARLAVWLQLGAAAIAFIATVVFGFMISGQTARLATVNAELDAAASRLATTDSATQAVLQAASALASGDAVRYDAAIASLGAVRAELASVSADLENAGAEAALGELRRVRLSINRTLASALFTRAQRKPEELAQAIALETENLAQPGLGESGIYASTIALATYHCAANDADAVRSLLTPAFIDANPAAARYGVLPDACRRLAGIGEAAVAPFDPAIADPAFRISTLHMQIAEEADRGAAQQLAETLCRDHGYTIFGIEKVDASKVKGTGEVIHYFADQAGEAAAIAGFARDMAGSAWTNLRPRQLAGIDNLPRNIAELWLPRRPTGAPAIAAAPRFSCRPPAAPADLSGAIAQLSSESRADRVAAGQTVANLMRAGDNRAVVAALLAELQPPRLEQLSASGRLNVLFMLNIEPSWAGRADAPALQEAIDRVRARAGQGIAIGNQTNDCLVKLETKLAGGSAPDQCGGL